MVKLWVSALVLFFQVNLAIAADVLSQKNTQLNQVNAKIVTLKKNLKMTEGERHRELQALKTTNQQINYIAARLKKLDEEIQQKQKELAVLKQQLQVYQAKLAKEKELLAQQLRASYQLGKYEYWQSLLNQQNPAKTLRLVTYYRYINDARMKTLVAIQQTQNKILKNQRISSEAVKRLNALYIQNQQQKSLLESKKNERQSIVNRLGKKIQSQSSQLKAYEANKKQLEALLMRLKSNTTQSVPSSAIPLSRMAHHLLWPTQGSLLRQTSRFNGIVILAPEGQPVVAVYPGKIVFSDWLKGFGFLTIIDHGRGYMTLYANNKSLARHRGDNVKAGDVIAYVGRTGILSQSGVYFEVRYNGKPTNPLQWLRNHR